ncbi:Dolichyl-diphosphooligosaccharide--protein glycosyltransferase subunit OST2 [Coniochaeta hoffmannii]|uniref:Dolichyl-diphosphooligosaccharide--protein glycosyltransferase subunit OST2 n=1 Tax=Coniochaeta hoffmannii TaxID=91930 RepID=A0AA38SJE1_9PEZI|nr:Dolichyl-diphosphooligosaccharide--protein glycosyltransferase subunit OST2 [Coniochaeta hoffmannii]
MAPKRANARDITPSSAATTQAGPTTAGTVPAATGSSSTKPHKTSTASLATKDGWEQVVGTVWNHYLEDTPQRTKLIDAFMAFLVVVGALQFLYCVLAGNYPFNAFLAGFGSTVGQFVLTASLRMQTTAANKSDFPAVSPERAFADYIVCSLILHFFCVNFIN